MIGFDRLTSLLERYRALGIDRQVDYEKFYLYSIITHSTAIEGSTLTEQENQLLFDEGISSQGRTIVEQMMNLDLKRAYEESRVLAQSHIPITADILRHLAGLVMKNTGSTYNTALGQFSSADGDFRLVNVSAGFGGRSYMDYHKVPAEMEEFCAWLNEERAKQMTEEERYALSFEAHYRLVTIHPWVDGNGRMARLLMNHIQFEFGLMPSKVLREDRGEYISALVTARDCEDTSVFHEFMVDEMVKTLSTEIDGFLMSTGLKKQKSRDRILEELREHPDYSSNQLAPIIGITRKGVEKQLAILKSQGLLRREGPDRGGRWVVAESNEERISLFTKLQNYFPSTPITKAWVFGSFARCEERPDSDLDLIVTYDKEAKVSLLDIIRMKLDMEQLTGRKIDLVEDGYLKDFAKESAEKDKYLIYERKH